MEAEHSQPGRHTLESRLGRSIALKMPQSPLTKVGWLVALDGELVTLLTCGTREELTAPRDAVMVVRWVPDMVEESPPGQPPLQPPPERPSAHRRPQRLRKGDARPVESTAQRLMMDIKRRLAAGEVSPVDQPILEEDW